MWVLDPGPGAHGACGARKQEDPVRPLVRPYTAGFAQLIRAVTNARSTRPDRAAKRYFVAGFSAAGFFSAFSAFSPFSATGFMSNLAGPIWNSTQGAPAAQPLVCFTPPGTMK